MGDKFVAVNSFPVGIEEDVKNEIASFDVVTGEEIEIVPISDEDRAIGAFEKDSFKVVNNNLGKGAWFVASKGNLDYIAGM